MSAVPLRVEAILRCALNGMFHTKEQSNPPHLFAVFVYVLQLQLRIMLNSASSGKRSPRTRRLRRRWIDNIKTDLLEIGVNVVDWIGLAQDRYRWTGLVNSVMNLRVP
jgi:hypothetical protein